MWADFSSSEIGRSTAQSPYAGTILPVTPLEQNAEPFYSAQSPRQAIQDMPLPQRSNLLTPVADSLSPAPFNVPQNIDNISDGRKEAPQNDSKDSLMVLKEDLKSDIALQNYVNSPTAKLALQSCVNELKDSAFSVEICFRNVSRRLSGAVQANESSRRSLDPFRAAWAKCHQV